MYCDGDVIGVNENYRLRVNVDNDTESPLEWGWGTEIHEIDNYRIWRGWEMPESDLLVAAYTAQQEVRSGRWTPEQRDRAIRLYMSLIGHTKDFEIHQWQGYSASDWATVLVLWDAEEGSNVYESWAAWRRGDVYEVIEEIREVYQSVNDPEDVMDVWTEGDSLGGCYLDDTYTAQVVAKEHFEAYPEEVVE